jgi:hypothetical protein
VRLEIEAIFARNDEPDDIIRELDALGISNDEWAEAARRFGALAEEQLVEIEMLKMEAEKWRRFVALMEPWVEQERAKGRPESELTWGNCQRETGLISQDEIDAREKWRKGPHCLEEQIYLDAKDEVSGLQEDHTFTTDELIDAVMRRMDRPEFAGKDKREGAIAIMRRFGFRL